ncbi:MAG TPA: ATP-binding protein [Pontiella sp.]
MGSFWSTDSSGPGNNFEALLIFRENFLKNSAVDIQISNEVLWNHFTTDIFIYIHQIISEAVTNALRHAQAEHIEIGIRKTDAAVIVFIENDGKPLPPEFDEGMGLPLMRYRASKIGAKLSISRCENNNTRVECTLPAG